MFISISAMIENYKAEIIAILQQSGESVTDEDSFSFSPLGEGMGYSSFLWTIFFGEKKYAVKITDPARRVVEMSKQRGMSDEDCVFFTQLFTEFHNRELQIYRWFQKNCHPDDSDNNTLHIPIVEYYGGTSCDNREAGIIIMTDLSSESVPVTRGGLSLVTIFSLINGVAAYQTAYLSIEEKIDLIPKDLLFTLVSSSVLRCIDGIKNKDWLTDDWKIALTNWAGPEQLRSMQYYREDGYLLHTLCHMDLWTNNILFSNGENGLGLLAVVDWQAATVGNPLIDVASVIGINMIPSERRAHETEILQYYIDALRRKSHAFKKDFPIGTVEQLLQSYRRALRFAALQLVMQLGYRPEEDVVDNASNVDNRSEKLGIYSARLKAILEDIC